MSSVVIDVLLIKKIEREIGRRLYETEIDQIRHEEPIWIVKINGLHASYVVPTYRMPYDLMPKDTDAKAIETQAAIKERFSNPFDDEMRLYLHSIAVQELRDGDNG